MKKRKVSLTKISKNYFAVPRDHITPTRNDSFVGMSLCAVTVPAPLSLKTDLDRSADSFERLH